MAGLTTPTTAYFGELDGGITPRIEAVVAAFQKAGFGTRAMADIRQVLWEKLMQIGTASGWSVSTLGLPLTFPDGLEVREGAVNYILLARDFLKVYKAMGYAAAELLRADGPVSRVRQPAARRGGGPDDAAWRALSSAHAGQRRDRGPHLHAPGPAPAARMEVDVILKPYLDKAAELGIEVPVLQYVYGVAKVQDSVLAD